MTRRSKILGSLLLALVLALFCSAKSQAQEEAEDSFKIPQVQMPEGYLSEYPWWQAIFGAARHPANKNTAVTKTESDFAFAQMVCITKMQSPSFAKLSDQYNSATGKDATFFRQELFNLLMLYAQLIPAESLGLISGLPNDLISKCPSQNPSWFMSQTWLDYTRAMKSTDLGKIFFGGCSSKREIKNFYERIRNQRSASAHELLAVYFLAEFGWMYQAGEEDFNALLKAKTTPSLAYNANVAEQISKRVPYRKIGIQERYNWSYTPLHSWLAESVYDDRYLIRWWPVIGAAIAADEALLDAWDGRGENGMPTNRFVASGLFTLHYVLAVSDVFAIKSVAVGTKNLVKELRSDASSEQVIQAVKNQKILSEAAVDQGANVLSKLDEAGTILKRTHLGADLDDGLELWVKALGFSEADSRAFGKILAEDLDVWADVAKYLDDAGTSADISHILDNLVAPKLKQTYAKLVAVNGDKYGDITKFGMLRENSLNDLVHTPFSGRYEKFKQMFAAEFATGKTAFWQTGRIEEQEFRLTTLAGNQKTGATAIYHSGLDAGQRATIRGHMTSLLRRALDPKISRKEVIDLVAEIHWWEAQSTSYFRGSQSISDITARAILKQRGIQAARWADSVSPDFYAFKYSVDDFKKLYPQLFFGGKAIAGLSTGLTVAAPVSISVIGKAALSGLGLSGYAVPKVESVDPDAKPAPLQIGVFIKGSTAPAVTVAANLKQTNVDSWASERGYVDYGFSINLPPDMRGKEIVVKAFDDFGVAHELGSYAVSQ